MQRISIAAVVLLIVVGAGYGIVDSVSSAREAAQRSTTICRMKQFGLGIQNYADAKKQLPPPASRDENGKPLLSWRVHILPFIEEHQLYSEFHLDEPWDSEHNKTLIPRMPGGYAHPKHGDLGGKTVFLMPTGEGTPFATDDVVTHRKITDGTSQTIAVVEADPDRAVPWTAPDDLPIDTANPTRGLGHVRSSGIVCVLYFDGHVGTIDAKSIDPTLLNALFTSQGGEKISDPNL